MLVKGQSHYRTECVDEQRDEMKDQKESRQQGELVELHQRVGTADRGFLNGAEVATLQNSAISVPASLSSAAVAIASL